ncbi:MAG: hypothetical protein OEZ10_10955 [Gammaproteobacteria bacterium]|nr:hypothetical protein [Gammaproteobacteria bacterium]
METNFSDKFIGATIIAIVVLAGCASRYNEYYDIEVKDDRNNDQISLNDSIGKLKCHMSGPAKADLDRKFIKEGMDYILLESIGVGWAEYNYSLISLSNEESMMRTNMIFSEGGKWIYNKMRTLRLNTNEVVNLFQTLEITDSVNVVGEPEEDGNCYRLTIQYRGTKSITERNSVRPRVDQDQYLDIVVNNIRRVLLYLNKSANIIW